MPLLPQNGFLEKLYKVYNKRNQLSHHLQPLWAAVVAGQGAVAFYVLRVCGVSDDVSADAVLSLLPQDGFYRFGIALHSFRCRHTGSLFVNYIA